jgi:hypothetical protein
MSVQVPVSRTSGALRYAKSEHTAEHADRLAALSEAIMPLQTALTEHPVYERMRTLEDVQVFMEHHVFAVWDFMTLLKALQTRLTCTSLPWRPIGDAMTRRLINEIVLDEESDEISPGRYGSHFELYLEAMAQAGASDARVSQVVDGWSSSSRAAEVIVSAKLPLSVGHFVAHTWRVAASLEDHSVAAAFALGRESVLSTIFGCIIKELPEASAARLSLLQSYLTRHIELDGESHHDLSLRMLARLCGDDDRKWHDALVVGQASLDARLTLWDGVVEALDRKLN